MGKDNPKLYKMKFSDEAKEAGLAIINGDQSKEALHNFLFQLISGDELRLQRRDQDPVWVFIGLQSLRSEKHFSDELDLTPKLARMKYAIRSCLFREALKVQASWNSREDRENDMLFKEAMVPLAIKFLGQGTASSFLNIVQLSKYASSLAYAKPPRAHIAWNDNFTQLQFDDKLLKLSDMRSGFKHAIEDVETLMGKLLCGFDLPVVLPEGLVDNLAEDRFAYSIGDMDGVSPRREDLINAFLMNMSSSLAMVVGDKMELNAGKAAKWMLDANEASGYQVRDFVLRFAYLFLDQFETEFLSPLLRWPSRKRD